MEEQVFIAGKPIPSSVGTGHVVWTDFLSIHCKSLKVIVYWLHALLYSFPLTLLLSSQTWGLDQSFSYDRDTWASKVSQQLPS